MGMEKRIHAYLWQCIAPTVNWLAQPRNSMAQPISEEVAAGINYSIILNSACYVEGALETGLKGIVEAKQGMFHSPDDLDLDIRRSLNLFMRRLQKDLNTRIGGTHGADNYSSMFELAVGTPLSHFEKTRPLWEGVRVLFHFRNMIAHGRRIEIHYTSTRAQSKTDMWIEEFAGGYSRVEEYLLKKALITMKFGEQNAACFFLGDAIADHFWRLAQDFVLAVSDSLSGIDRDAFNSALRP